MSVVRVERSLIPFKITRVRVPVGYQEHVSLLGDVCVVAEDQVHVTGHSLLGIPIIAAGTYTGTEIAANTTSLALPFKTITFEWQPDPSDP
jgi:hypothetical protein